MGNEWLQSMAPDWADAMVSQAEPLDRIGQFLAVQEREGGGFLPGRDAVLRAFAEPMSDVKVLIVGQDPYPTSGHAMGLSFSVPAGVAMPRSLVNIAAELRADTGEELTDGDLTHWAQQGVLLLNRVLTVSPGLPGSHRRRGWEEVTEHAIRALVRRGGPLVAVLWGRDAQAARLLLHDVPCVESAHPSPLSASRGFFGSRPFSHVNGMLTNQGARPVRWGTARR